MKKSIKSFELVGNPNNSFEQDELFNVAGVIYKVEEIKNETTYLIKKVRDNVLKKEDIFQVDGNAYIVSYSEENGDMIINNVSFNPFIEGSERLFIEKGC
jgi:hypothetical protein